MSKLERNGFQIKHVEYVDFIGSLVITFTKLLRIKLDIAKT